MRNTFSIPPTVAAMISIVAVTVGFAFSATVGTAGATTPVERTAAQTFCAQVNAERSARGLSPLHCTYDGAAQNAANSHTDSTDVWVPFVANPATATIAFMQSADHRWWLMDPTAATIDIGVACVDYRSGDGWTEHLMDVGANLPGAHGPDGAPPPGYVTRPSSATPCGAATPPRTPPPASSISAPSSPPPSRGAQPTTPAPTTRRPSAPPVVTASPNPSTVVPSSHPSSNVPATRGTSPHPTTVSTRAEAVPRPHDSVARVQAKPGAVTANVNSSTHNRGGSLSPWWWMLGVGSIAVAVVLIALTTRHRRSRPGVGK